MVHEFWSLDNITSFIDVETSNVSSIKWKKIVAEVGENKEPIQGVPKKCMHTLDDYKYNVY